MTARSHRARLPRSSARAWSSAMAVVRMTLIPARSSAAAIGAVSLMMPAPTAAVCAFSARATSTIRAIVSLGLSVPRKRPPSACNSRANCDASSTRRAASVLGTVAAEPAAPLCAGTSWRSSASRTLEISLWKSPTLRSRPAVCGFAACRAAGFAPPAQAWHRKIAHARPVAEWRRHPAHVAAARKRPCHERGQPAHDAYHQWMVRHAGKRFDARACAARRARPLGNRQPAVAVARSFLPAQVQQDARDVDLHRADFAARAAQRRGERQMGGGSAEQARAYDRADSPRVSRAIGVAADSPVYRADVEARPAAQTKES